MRSLLLPACAVALIVSIASLEARADTGDETLKHYIENSDLVLDVTVVELGGAKYTEAGVAHYLPKLEVHAVLKGELAAGNDPPRIAIVRLEIGEEDRLPYLKDGARVVLFVKKNGERGKPRYQTADVWFGVQPYTRWMVRRLGQLCEQEQNENEAWVGVAAASSEYPEAMDRVFGLLEKAGIDAVGVGNAGWETASVARKNAERARKLLRDALASPEAEEAREAAEKAGVDPPASWNFRVLGE